jgi:positive regulator of sigma E activity
MVHLRLTENVTFVDSSTPSEIYRPRDVPLEAVPMPQHVLETVDSLSDAELLGVPEDLAEASGTKQHREYTRILNELDMPELNLGPKIEDKRVSVLKDVVMIGLEIGATLHSRLAFSASVLVMLVLAAGLAIILRGGQMLTAFAIAFFPGLMVVVMNVMGRSMAEKTGTQIVGIVVIWAGLVLLAIADAIILTRYLKR